MGATGATGPAGTDGTAATVSVGTVTTGGPGTEAAVTNSGTPQNAVLDFTIPQGAAGTSGAPVELLSSYSTQPQAGTGSTPLEFDRNALSYGTDIAHADNSTDITISQPGVYSLAFSGSFAPGSGASFPLNVGTAPQLNGTEIAGAASQNTFTDANDVASQSFSVPFTVTTAPATLQIVSTGDSFVYSNILATVSRLGDIPS